MLVICSLIWQGFETEICLAKAFRFCTTMGESSSTRSYSDMTAALNQSQRFREAMNWIASCLCAAFGNWEIHESSSFPSIPGIWSLLLPKIFCGHCTAWLIAQLDWTSGVQNSSTLWRMFLFNCLLVSQLFQVSECNLGCKICHVLQDEAWTLFTWWFHKNSMNKNVSSPYCFYGWRPFRGSYH